MKNRGSAAATLLAGLVGVIIGALIVWGVASRHYGGVAGVALAPGQALPGPAVTTSSEQAIITAVQNVGPAVVKVSTVIPAVESPTERMLRQFLNLPQPFPKEGEGSGVIIDGKNGYIVTNSHVVRGASKVQVTLSEGRQFDAHVVGSDPLSDVAVVQIKGSNLPFAKLGSAAKVPIGAWVIAIGNPFGFQNSVTVGVVSAKGRQIADPTGATLQDLIQTDASINPGNSGGALVDLSGQVIGIPTAIIPQAQGIGFAISVDSARGIFEKLIKTGKMPWLGVAHHFLSPDEAKKLGVPGSKGALVVQVVGGGPADRAGIKQGDVIMRLGGRAIDGEQALGNAVRASNAGDKVDAVIWRDKKEITVRVTLGAVPSQLGGRG